MFESIFVFWFAGSAESLSASKHGYAVMRRLFSIIDRNVLIVNLISSRIQPRIYGQIHHRLAQASTERTWEMKPMLKKNTHTPYNIKPAWGKCPNRKRAVAKIEIEKALSTKKGRKASLCLFHTPSTVFCQKYKTKRPRGLGGKKWLLFLGPRPPDIQIYVLASDRIGRAIIRICSDFGTSIWMVNVTKLNPIRWPFG